MNDEKIICPRPFMELSLKHDGVIQPCCLLEQYPIGNIQDSDLISIWNNEKLQSLRNEFINQEIKTCSNNIKTKQCHKYYAHHLKEVSIKKIQNSPPVKLDLRLNGQCNIECIMCDVWSGPNQRYNHPHFWEKAKKDIFPHVKYIDLLGGEPFIQKDTYKLIDEVSEINPSCKWTITTNANWNLKGQIKEYLDKIDIDCLTISIDGIFPDTYLKIRKKGNYRQVINTINDLLKYRAERSFFRIKLDFCVQIINMNEIIQFYNFCKEKNVEGAFIFLTIPNELSLVSLQPQEAKEIYDKIRYEYLRTRDHIFEQVLFPLQEHFGF